MKESGKQKWILRCDGGILFAGIFLALALGLWGNGLPSRILLAASLLCAAAAGADLMLRMKRGGGRGAGAAGSATWCAAISTITLRKT